MSSNNLCTVKPPQVGIIGAQHMLTYLNADVNRKPSNGDFIV